MSTIIAVFIFLFFLSAVYAGFKGAPWVPTRKKDVVRFLKLAEIQPGQRIIDLGCGDGRIICAAVKAGAEARGYELSLFPYLLANARRLFQKNRERIKISYGDFWSVDLGDADIIYFFLMPKIYPKLKEKFEKELKKKAKVIAYVWPIDGWQPLKIDHIDGRSNLFLYQI